jgi:glycosyltransferase involved in cell wall biosynthesis
LIDHWRCQYGYASDNHLVVPCTYSSHFENWQPAAGVAKRRELGFLDNNVVYVFAGRTSAWQSAHLLIETMTFLLAEGKMNKLLLLSSDPALEGLAARFPAQVKAMSLEPAQVPNVAAAGDYGVLLREPTVTNRVAAPVKFAEYMACGLPVICSDCIGDYPEFLRTHAAGLVLKGPNGRIPPQGPVPFKEKLRIRHLAENFYSKTSGQFRRSYSKVAEAMC